MNAYLKRLARSSHLCQHQLYFDHFRLHKMFVLCQWLGQSSMLLKDAQEKGEPLKRKK